MLSRNQFKIKLSYQLALQGIWGLMVWHGGISGSAPIKLNENVGHLAAIMSNNSFLS
jgi:short-chain fatty acids transporter